MAETIINKNIGVSSMETQSIIYDTLKSISVLKAIGNYSSALKVASEVYDSIINSSAFKAHSRDTITAIVDLEIEILICRANHIMKLLKDSSKGLKDTNPSIVIKLILETIRSIKSSHMYNTDNEELTAAVNELEHMLAIKVKIMNSTQIKKPVATESYQPGRYNYPRQQPIVIQSYPPDCSNMRQMPLILVQQIMPPGSGPYNTTMDDSSVDDSSVAMNTPSPMGSTRGSTMPQRIIANKTTAEKETTTPRHLTTQRVTTRRITAPRPTTQRVTTQRATTQWATTPRGITTPKGTTLKGITTPKGTTLKGTTTPKGITTPQLEMTTTPYGEIPYGESPYGELPSDETTTPLGGTTTKGPTTTTKGPTTTTKGPTTTTKGLTTTTKGPTTTPHKGTTTPKGPTTTRKKTTTTPKVTTTTPVDIGPAYQTASAATALFDNKDTNGARWTDNVKKLVATVVESVNRYFAATPPQYVHAEALLQDTLNQITSSDPDTFNSQLVNIQPQLEQLTTLAQDVENKLGHKPYG